MAHVIVKNIETKGIIFGKWRDKIISAYNAGNTEVTSIVKIISSETKRGIVNGEERDILTLFIEVD